LPQVRVHSSLRCFSYCYVLRIVFIGSSAMILLYKLYTLLPNRKKSGIAVPNSISQHQYVAYTLD
jgi:hypothetical protein